MSEPEPTTLRLSRDGSVLTIELHRPDSLNALTTEVADELRAAIESAGRDDEVGAVVLTGAGRAFSSGADLKATNRSAKPNGAPDFATDLRDHFNWPVRAIRELPKPVIAALNGPAVGVGVSWALACDVVVAARSSYLLLAFVNIGLVPDGGASALISARAGAGRFAQLALLGERLPAETAETWGLVDRVSDDDATLADALQLARRMADGPVGAYASIKRMVNEGPLRGLEDALELEAVLQGDRADSPEFLEGVTAFLQKRPAQFNPAARVAG